MVICMLAAYLVGRRLWPRYAVVGVLAAGVAIAAMEGTLRANAVPWSPTLPVFVAPEFSWRATVSLALPLFIVTMASQNLPGVAAIRAAGYVLPVSKIIVLTGVATLLLNAARDTGATLIVATHDPALLARLRTAVHAVADFSKLEG